MFIWAPKVGELKFNVDEAAMGKLGPTGVGGVLCDNQGVVVAIFSKHVGLESNETEVVAILEALWIYSPSFHEKLMAESDSMNNILWASSSSRSLLRCHVYLNEIRVLVSSIQAVFQHVGRSANSFLDGLAKQEMDRSIDLVALSL